MDKLVIEGGSPLKGRTHVSGSKNAALPILFATVLSDQPQKILHIPQLVDIATTLKMLKHLGARVERDLETESVEIELKDCLTFDAPYDLVRTMRASVLVLGPLLARFGTAKVSLPGGCSIGARPVNLHLMALEKMGAEISIENGYIHAGLRSGLKRLHGAQIAFPSISVGATENTLMAAALADGETRILNAAREPEIVDLARFLKSMGAKISGEGTDEIVVQGVSTLNAAAHTVIPDRIEAGTYLSAVAVAGGTIELENVPWNLLTAVLNKLEETGCHVDPLPGPRPGIRLTAPEVLKPTDIVTKEFPGFPTDMQAQLMTVLTEAQGSSIITENIFENRFMHVPELQRLGADIQIKGNAAVIKGRGRGHLSGATVMATDLRASACLVLAGLAAKGTTHVRRIYHLDRGYDGMEKKLASLGAKIRRMKEEDGE